MTARNLHRLHDNILQIQFLPYSWYVSPANRAAMRVCGDFLSISVSGLSENGNQRQRKLSETARTVGRSGSAGAEKRQPFILPIFRCAESPPESAQNRSKQPGPLSLPSRAPVCPHSGSQRLTGANAELLPAMPASAAHGDAQRRSRPDKAVAGCAAPRPVPAAGWYGAAYRSDAKARLRYPGSCCPFFVVLQVVPALAAPADISVVSLGKGAVLWYNFISRSMETRGYAREIKP